MIGHGSKKGLTVKEIAASKETVKSQAAAAKLAELKTFECTTPCPICKTHKRASNGNCVKCNRLRQRKHAETSERGQESNSVIDKQTKMVNIATNAFRLIKGE